LTNKFLSDGKLLKGGFLRFEIGCDGGSIKLQSVLLSTREFSFENLLS
jgi:hypothetical protein